MTWTDGNRNKNQIVARVMCLNHSSPNPVSLELIWSSAASEPYSPIDVGVGVFKLFMVSKPEISFLDCNVICSVKTYGIDKYIDHV